MSDDHIIRQPLLKTGSTIAPGLDMAPGGSPFPRPSITFSTDTTHGVYISEIRLGELVFTFAPTYLFTMGLFNDDTETGVDLSGQVWSPTVSENEATGVVTLTLTMPAPYTGIIFTAVFTPTAEGYSITFGAANTNASWAIDYCEFPRIGCTSPSGLADNTRLAHGFVGGLVARHPHLLDLTAFQTAIEAPPSMQFVDYYDVTTKAHLYMAWDDDAGYRKQWQIRGDLSSIMYIGFRHFFPNPRIATNGGVSVMPYTFTYHTILELFRGKTADGRCGHYDAAIRYRTWGTNASRFWMANGPWVADSSTSTLVKNSDFLYMTGNQRSPSGTFTPWTNFIEDMRRIKVFIGAANIIGLLYAWADGLDFMAPNGFMPPKFFPTIENANQDTALGTALAQNIHLSYYTCPLLWETLLAGAGGVPFQYDHFIGTVDFGSMASFVIRDKNNVPISPDFQPGLPVIPDF